MYNEKRPLRNLQFSFKSNSLDSFDLISLCLKMVQFVEPARKRPVDQLHVDA